MSLTVKIKQLATAKKKKKKEQPSTHSQLTQEGGSREQQERKERSERKKEGGGERKYLKIQRRLSSQGHGCAASSGAERYENARAHTTKKKEPSKEEINREFFVMGFSQFPSVCVWLLPFLIAGPLETRQSLRQRASCLHHRPEKRRDARNRMLSGGDCAKKPGDSGDGLHEGFGESSSVRHGMCG